MITVTPGSKQMHYVVHCRGDEDLKTTLCAPDLSRVRYSKPGEERHIVVSPARVVHSLTAPEFENGRTHQAPEMSMTMRFCTDCQNHPDLELLALAEL